MRHQESDLKVGGDVGLTKASSWEISGELAGTTLITVLIATSIFFYIYKFSHQRTFFIYLTFIFVAYLINFITTLATLEFQALRTKNKK